MLDAALAELEVIDPQSLTDDELHALVVEQQALASRMAAVRASFVGEWDRRRLWADDGSRAAWARLSRECALSPQTARSEVLRAKKLHSMSATAAAFVDGKLSTDQVDLLTFACQPDIAHLLERDEQLLLGELPGLRYPDARRFIDYWIEQAFEEAGRERSRPDPAGRHVTATRGFNGHFDLSGWLDPIAGTEIANELEAIEQDLFEADWKTARAEHGRDALPAQLPRTGRQRRHDALAQMARNSRACRLGKYRQPRPLITVHVGRGTLSRMCELADGTVISPSQVFPRLAEADIETIVFDGPRRVLDVSQRERFFTGALRRAIEARDRHCQHPSGCDIAAEDCQVDHKIRWTDGGPTTQDNGRCYCRTHNLQRENHHDLNERPPPDDW